VTITASSRLDIDISVKVKQARDVQISELSRATGASPRSLRYYEQLGFLAPERLGNGYREYDDSAVATVGTIRMLFDLGLPSDLIAQVLPCAQGGKVADVCPGIFDRVAAIRDDMDARAAELLRTRDALTASLATVGR
jgi:DNA-binding transcriptional MerR regulator